jgi:hypothetical protein
MKCYHIHFHGDENKKKKKEGPLDDEMIDQVFSKRALNFFSYYVMISVSIEEQNERRKERWKQEEWTLAQAGQKHHVSERWRR